MKRRVLPIALLLLAPSVAFADPPKGATDPAAAQALFTEARQLMANGKYVEACPKLEESLRLDHGLGTQFNLADCNEHIGKLATAWASFLDVAAQSKARNQTDREALARKRATAIESRVPKLVVEVPASTPNVEVRRDGVVVGAAAWGTAIPVDSGAHRITVSAPGKQWETTVQAAEGTIARVSVPRELPAAPASIGAVGATGARPVDSGATVETTQGAVASFPPPVVEGRGTAQRSLGWIIAGTGLVGVGVGLGFGLSSLSKRDASRTHCVGDACDAEGVSLREDALRHGDIATVATIAGAAAIAGGLVLVLTAPKGSRERVGKVQAVPIAGLGGGGLMLQGKFQ